MGKRSLKRAHGDSSSYKTFLSGGPPGRRPKTRRRLEGDLLGRQVVAVSPHGRNQTAVPGADRVGFAPAGQEMMVHEPDDVEAVGHDRRALGKCFRTGEAVSMY